MALNKPSPSPRNAGPKHSGRLISKRITKFAFSSTLSPSWIRNKITFHVKFKYDTTFDSINTNHWPRRKNAENPNIFLLRPGPNQDPGILFQPVRNSIANHISIDRWLFFPSNAPWFRQKINEIESKTGWLRNYSKQGGSRRIPKEDCYEEGIQSLLSTKSPKFYQCES